MLNSMKLSRVDVVNNYLYCDGEMYSFVFENTLNEQQKDFEKNVYVFKYLNEFEERWFGFSSCEKRFMFANLVKIKTIGISTAKTIMLNFSVNEILTIIKANDVDMISSIKGIGNFSAKLIVVELNKIYFDISLSTKQEKILEGLKKLGYKTKDIYPILMKQPKKASEEQIIENILQELKYHEL